MAVSYKKVSKYQRERMWRIQGIHITWEEYLVLKEKQNNTCAICYRPPKTRSLHVDHDHKTGKIRGLLCFLCNRFLTQRGVTSDQLRSAADYLDRSK